MKKKQVILVLAFILTVVFCLSYAYFIEPRQLVVRQVDLKVLGWDSKLDGLKIAILSDIHAGSNYVTKDRLRQIVSVVNKADPDLVVILGDFVSPGRGEFQIVEMPESEIADGLSGLRARLGVYAVFGNWDFWSERILRRELGKVGIRILENEVVVIEQEGTKFRLFGLEDHTKFGSWKPKIEKWKEILAPTEEEGDLIVLEHSPDVLPMITGERLISPKLRLILAGHTHGGQVWLPLIGSPLVPSSYGQRYVRGHIRENGVDMFVTTGIGTSILPIRFMVPPEVVILRVFAEN